MIVSACCQKYSYERMSQDILELSKKYSAFFHYHIIGRSEDDRKIYEITIGNTDAPNVLLVIAAIHGREYMTSLLCMKQIEYYLDLAQSSEKKQIITEFLEHTAIRYIPMANPDGVTISQFGFGRIQNEAIHMQWGEKKVRDTKRWKANARGVDLNRNFPYHFYVTGEIGKEGYSGKEPVSEKESKAIERRIDYLRQTKVLGGVIHYHATGSEIYGACRGNTEVTKKTAMMFWRAKKLTGYPEAEHKKNLFEKSRKEGMTGQQYRQENPFSDNGNLREYLLYHYGIPSITIEIGRLPCPVPLVEFPFIWRRNKDIVIQEALLMSEEF